MQEELLSPERIQAVVKNNQRMNQTEKLVSIAASDPGDENEEEYYDYYDEEEPSEEKIKRTLEK